jgi:putative lipoic acid-binding regulatory protein
MINGERSIEQSGADFKLSKGRDGSNTRFATLEKRLSGLESQDLPPNEFLSKFAELEIEKESASLLDLIDSDDPAVWSQYSREEVRELDADNLEYRLKNIVTYILRNEAVLTEGRTYLEMIVELLSAGNFKEFVKKHLDVFWVNRGREEEELEYPGQQSVQIITEAYNKIQDKLQQVIGSFSPESQQQKELLSYYLERSQVGDSEKIAIAWRRLNSAYNGANNLKRWHRTMSYITTRYESNDFVILVTEGIGDHIKKKLSWRRRDSPQVKKVIDNLDLSTAQAAQEWAEENNTLE